MTVAILPLQAILTQQPLYLVDPRNGLLCSDQGCSGSNNYVRLNTRLIQCADIEERGTSEISQDTMATGWIIDKQSKKNRDSTEEMFIDAVQDDSMH